MGVIVAFWMLIKTLNVSQVSPHFSSKSTAKNEKESKRKREQKENVDEDDNVLAVAHFLVQSLSSITHCTWLQEITGLDLSQGQIIA